MSTQLEICLASVCFLGWQKDEIDGVFTYGKRAGYSFVELQTSGDNRYDRLVVSRSMSELKQKLQDAGMTPVVLYGPAWGGESREDAEQNAEVIKDYLRAARELNVNTVVSTDGLRVAGGLDMILVCLDKLIPFIEKLNIKIGLEPHYKNRLEQIADYEYIFGKLDHPNIGLCPDTGQFYSAGVNTIEIINKWPHKIFHVHIKDHVGTQSVRFGHGEIDNFSIIKKLKKVGYNGFLSVELEVKDKSATLDYIVEAREYLEDILKRV